MRARLFTTVLLWLLGFSQSAAASNGSVPLPAVERLLDPTRELSLPQAQASRDWERDAKATVGFREVDLWVRFFLANPSAEAQQLIVEDQWALTDSIHLWVIAAGEILQTAHVGHRSPPTPQQSFHRFPFVSIAVPPGGAWVYVLYETNDVVGHRLALWEPDPFARYRSLSQWFLGLVLGCILVMSLYNFCLFAVLHIRAYLYYSLYTLCFWIFQASFNGLAAQYLSHQDWLTDDAMLAIGMVTIVFIYAFTRVYLRLPELSPLLSRFGVGIAVGALLTVPWTFVSFQSASAIGVLSNLATCIWVILVAVTLSLRRIPEAYVYLVAWSIFALGDAMSVFYWLGWTEASLLSQWGILVGSAIEVVLLSFGLARYVYSMKQDMLAAKVSEADLQGHIKAAGEIQSTLLTISAPSDFIKVASRYRIAEVAAGDWFCVEGNTQGDKVYAAIGDVTGHGLSASVVASVVSGTIKSAIHLSEALAVDAQSGLLMVMQEANRAVLSTGREHGHLMSLLLICCDLRAGQLYFLNAGHLHFLQQQDGQVHTRFQPGSLLGLHAHVQWKVGALPLKTKDRLLLFTDGLLENTGPDGKGLSQRALNKSMHAGSELSLEMFASVLIEEADARSKQIEDDVTILVLEILQLQQQDDSPQAA